MAKSFQVKITTALTFVGALALLSLINIHSYRTYRARQERQSDTIDENMSPNGSESIFPVLDDVGNETKWDLLVRKSEDEISALNNSELTASFEASMSDFNDKKRIVKMSDDNETIVILDGSTGDDNPLEIALMRLHQTTPAANASKISHIGVFKQQFGLTNIWAHHIKLLVPYNFEIYLQPLSDLEELLNVTIDKVSNLTQTWKGENFAKYDRGDEFGSYDSRRQSKLCRGMRYSQSEPESKFTEVCKYWSLAQFSNYLIRELRALHEAAMGHIDTVKLRVLGLKETFKGLKDYGDGDRDGKQTGQDTKNKRHAGHLVGELEKQLFGLVTLSDLNALTAVVDNVIKTQNGIIMAAEFSTAVLKTHTTSIISISHAVQQLQHLVMNVTENIKDDIGKDFLITKILTNNLYTQSASNIYIRAGMILQDLETYVRTTSDGLNSAILNSFTPDVLGPEQLKATLEDWEQNMFSSDERFLWPKNNTDEIIKYYSHSCIKLLNSRRTNIPTVQLTIPTTRQSELLLHYRIVTLPYKLYRNESTYRVATGLSTEVVDILTRGKDIFLADPEKFEYHLGQGVDIYNTDQLTKLSGANYECILAILQETVLGVMKKCMLKADNTKLASYQITKNRYVMYSEAQTQLSIKCSQSEQTENHFERIMETIYLNELTVPDICTIKIGNVIFLGEPFTLMTQTIERTDEFKLIVQSTDSFDPNMWQGILENIAHIETETVEHLLHDLATLEIIMPEDGDNSTQKLIDSITNQLTETRHQHRFSRQLFDMIQNPWLMSYSTMAFIIFVMSILLLCVIKKLYCRREHRSYYKTIETIENFEMNPETLDTESLVTLISARLAQEIPAIPGNMSD